MNPRLAFAVRADYDRRWVAQVTGDAQKVANSVKSSGAAVGNSMKGATVNTANLAAQFNDIGVTLASGQSPLLIALQQGTQISQALGPMGAAGSVKALGSAFLSIISPLSLITIGTIAVGAAAIQWLMGLNRESPKAEDSLKAHRAWLDKILEGYDDVRKSADAYLTDTMKLPTGAISSDVAAQAKNALKEYEGALGKVRDVQAEINQRVADWTNLRALSAQQFPDDVERAQRFNDLIDQAGKITALSTANLDDLITSLTEIKNSGVDYKLATFAERMLADATSAKTLRAEVSSLASVLAQLGAAAAGLPAMGKAFGGAMDSLSGLGLPPQSDRQQAQQALNGGLGEAQDMVTRTAVLNAYNDAIARISTREAEEEALKRGKEFVKTGNEQQKAYQTVMDSLAMQTVALGLNSREQEKLNQIKAAGVDADSAQAQSIRDAVDALYDQKDAIAAVAEEQKKTKAIIDDLQAGTTTFLSQILQGLRQGESGWKAFGQAGANALDTLAQKLLNSAVSNFFLSLFGGSMFGSLGNDIGPGATFGGVQSFLKSANGNVFASPALSAYSGSVVSRPTVFPFANGVGLMGEAGPEAILPLKRGSNGKLGVSMGGGQGGSSVVRIELADGLMARVVQQSGEQTVRIIQSTVPNMIKTQAPAASMAAQRNRMG